MAFVRVQWKESSMSDNHEAIDRREFTLQAAMAILAGVTITVAEGCGSYSSMPSPSPTPTPTTAPTSSDINGNISANHGHTAVIAGAQITSGNAIALDITGMATHPHTVQISQADLTSLKNRQAVSRDSTNNSGHMHTVTFTPA
jgi:hypothetical protein